MRWEVRSMRDRIHDAFDSVHAEESLKRSVKAFISEQTRTERRQPRFARFAAALACLALVMLGVGGWRLYRTPVSAISVDVNPSVELGINRFDRVVSVTGYNDDGAAVAASVELKNLPYAEALTALLDSDAMAPYLSGDALVSVTVIGDTEQKGEEMLSRIAACRFAGSPEVECRRGNREDVKAAHEAGLSFGKYRAFLELQRLDPSVTVEDVSGWTMRQLRDRIDESSGVSDGSRGGNGRGHNGNRRNADEGESALTGGGTGRRNGWVTNDP